MRKRSFVIANVGFHLACCGGLILVLASSGWLLVLSSTARNKGVLVVLLVMTAGAYWVYRRHASRCSLSGSVSAGNKVALYGLSTLWITLLLFIVITYLVIPLWLPGYSGETLLPGGGGPVLPGL